MLTDQLLLDYKRCQRRAYLNIHGDGQLQDQEGDFRLKLRQEAINHVQNILKQFYPHYVQVTGEATTWQEKAEITSQLMQQGEPCIYQGVLYRLDYSIPLVGFPHLLLKQPGNSCFGDWSYLPVTIQLGRRPKPEYKLIAVFYAYLLQNTQNTLPSHAQIILRRQNNYNVEVKSWLQKLQQTLASLLDAIAFEKEPEVFISRQRCSLCQWYTNCYTLAQNQQHLSLVPGVTPSRYQKLKAMGIQSLSSLAEISHQTLTKKIETTIALELKQQALAIVENRPVKKISPSSRSQKLISHSIELYFDIEAEPERQLDYLLGVLVVNNHTQTDKFYPFLAESPEEEGQVWQQFLDLVSLYPQAPIFHYSEYETETIKRLSQLYQTPKEQKLSLLSRLFDLHGYVTNSIIFPVENYSLKTVANWLGFQWRQPGVNGAQSVYWYDQWLKNSDRHLLELIINYNEDDCRATRHLKDWLVDFVK